MNAAAQAGSMRGMSSMFTGRPTDVEIKIIRRAYELYSARGGEAGHDLEDWLRAEKEIMGDAVRSDSVEM
jgi:hypothetical protein